MTFIYELNPKSVEIHRMCSMNFLFLKALESFRLTDIHTYIQTDRTKIITHAALRVVTTTTTTTKTTVLLQLLLLLLLLLLSEYG